MRAFIFLLCTTVFSFNTVDSYSQQKIKIKKDMEMSIDEVFKVVSKQSKFSFLYPQELFKDAPKVNLKEGEILLNQLLTNIFSNGDTSFRLSENNVIIVEKSDPKQLNELKNQKIPISGTVLDQSGEPLPGASIVEKGTLNGVQTDFDGKFSLDVKDANAILEISFVGFETKEIVVKNQTELTITLLESTANLDEVVIVGYGTRKKSTVTSAVAQIDAEVFEDRSIASVTQGLQGAVSGLVITNSQSGGEPGAQQNINIRGLLTSTGNDGGANGNIVNSEPLVLIDGAVMNINDINPEDIETVSVLKDAASAAIYGSRAAGGAILITTKSGKNMKGGMKVNYSNSFSLSSPTQWPQQSDAVTYAHVMNDSRFNMTGQENWYFSEEAIGWIQQNLDNPGSAPTTLSKNNDTDWVVNSGGLGGSAATDWKDFLFKDYAKKSKHNLSFRGGDEKLNYYISAGVYSEDGLFDVAENTFDRYNLDAKIASSPNKWLKFELLTKLQRSDAEFPWDPGFGRGRVFDQLSKLKPTMPIVDPTWGEPMPAAYYPRWQHSSEVNTSNQLVLLPRVVIEPLKDWFINLEYNYRTNNNKTVFSSTQYESKRPNGESKVEISRDQTLIRPRLSTNDYWSPNLYSSYSKSIGGHNFDATVGYQSERYNVYNLNADAAGVLSDEVPSISTAVGEQTVTDVITHWSTESVFGRIGYNYKEKYIARVTYRRDGTSRFEPDNRWAGFPSFELGYNVAKENFWPIEDISMFKLRASKGSLGNQNVGLYGYITGIPVGLGSFLFNGEREYTANVQSTLPNDNLTWETVKTTDVGIDILALNNKLGFSFDWFRSDITDLATGGPSLPAVLGTADGALPLVNGGVARTQGWETEISWKQSLGDFNYNIRVSLTDYKQTIVEFDNATALLNDRFAGKDLGDIWGFTWDGWFESDEQAAEQTALVSQKWHSPWSYKEGDTRYANLNGDDAIDIGDNTVDDHGDLSVIGNTTPRYQYGIALGASYKGLDFNMFVQGVGKRDINPIQSNYKKQFLGPAQGPFHSNVYEEHLDYYRPENTTSPLGPNTDSYFARPYAQNGGRNNKNTKSAVDHYLQNGAYARLKTVQLGFTIPKNITEKYKIDRFRIFVTGENLLTVSDLLFYDPESVRGTFSGGSSYPLSKTISAGINVSF
ncbi:SusC/RagA family TonB-linked outer membrane protein [Aureibaculum luteum]|uniref:SusC/RagA family TonB-linked outer membrane protein n=1 Tax=Aureibaculum luteum TaxID=1548456 RepID=UPI001300A38F|nr:TonB-dependent receptor [Aureibaculum luteum]